MTGRRKSCKACKKAAASSLPIVEVGVPGVDGFLFQNTDDEENRTPGFRSRTADASPDPVTAGTADAALARTEPTPGFRKTASRKAATQASSFTVVAQQKDKGEDNKEAKDNGKINTKDSSCSDKKDPKDAAGCSDQRASKAEVAVHVEAFSEFDISGTLVNDVAKEFMVGNTVLNAFRASNRTNLKDLIKRFIKKHDEGPDVSSWTWMKQIFIDGETSNGDVSSGTTAAAQYKKVFDVDDAVEPGDIGDAMSEYALEGFDYYESDKQQTVAELCRLFLEVKLRLCLGESDMSVTANKIKECYQSTGAPVDSDSESDHIVTVHAVGKNRSWTIEDMVAEFPVISVIKFFTGDEADPPEPNK